MLITTVLTTGLILMVGCAHRISVTVERLDIKDITPARVSHDRIATVLQGLDAATALCETYMDLAHEKVGRLEGDLRSESERQGPGASGAATQPITADRIARLKEGEKEARDYWQQGEKLHNQIEDCLKDQEIEDYLKDEAKARHAERLKRHLALAVLYTERVDRELETNYAYLKQMYPGDRSIDILRNPRSQLAYQRGLLREDAGFGGFCSQTEYEIRPEDPEYGKVLAARGCWRPFTKVSVDAAGESTVLIVQEKPGQIRLLRANTNGAQLAKNISAIADKALQAAVKYAAP